MLGVFGYVLIWCWFSGALAGFAIAVLFACKFWRSSVGSRRLRKHTSSVSTSGDSFHLDGKNIEPVHDFHSPKKVEEICWIYMHQTLTMELCCLFCSWRLHKWLRRNYVVAERYYYCLPDQNWETLCQWTLKLFGQKKNQNESWSFVLLIFFLE